MNTSTVRSTTLQQPKCLAELLPGLSAFLSEDTIRTLTATKKRPRTTIAPTRTDVKVVRPLTIAELKAGISALNPHSPRRHAQAVSSAKKKGWNSSVKVEFKTKSHTANGQLKNNPVRKVLNFQPKHMKPMSNPNMTNQTETPKFQKPESRAKKSLHVQVKNTVRISGICNMPPTPVETSSQRRMTTANKENSSYVANKPRKVLSSTPNIYKKNVIPKIMIDTPLSTSSCDASFLQKEKEINDAEEKIKEIIEEPTLENIAEVSPPISTPFNEYRSVQEYFNNTGDIDNSALCQDNTIMCFDKPSVCTNNDKKEESVIVTLCDLFNKATVTNSDEESTEFDKLLEVEKQTEQNIKMIEGGIEMLINIKESHIKSLQNVRKLIQKKKNAQTVCESDKDKTLVQEAEETLKVVKEEMLSPGKSPILSIPCSVIKSCIKSQLSPSYKVPKKGVPLRKKINFKSMPNESSGMDTPVKDIDGKAHNIYMKLKEQYNFLSTPKVNRALEVPNTPTITSRNLQKQLDKLYNRS